MSRAVKNLSRRKIRAALIVIALGFCMAILIAVPPGIAANQAATKNVTGNLGNTLTQTEAAINKTLTQIQCTLTSEAAGYGLTDNGVSTIQGGAPNIRSGLAESFKPMNESLYSDINPTLNDVAAIEHILQVDEGVHSETITNDGPAYTLSFASYVIVGVPLNSSLLNNYPILPTNITAGRNLESGDTYGVLLSENNSAYFHAGVGDKVNILGTDFTVVGIYSPVGTVNYNLYMSLPEAQALTNNTGIVTQINVFADTSDDVTALSQTLSSMHPELIVTTAQEQLATIEKQASTYNSLLNSAEDTMNQTQTQAVAEIAIAVAATSIIVLFVMLYAVRERTKEIGTLKAIGASNTTIMGQFLVEGILLSILAGAVGIAIGTFAAPALSSILLPTVGHFGGGDLFVGNTASTPSISVSPELMLIGFGAAVLLGAIGSLYPAWRAARTRPAEAMRYE